MKKKRSERRKKTEEDRDLGIGKIVNDHASDVGPDRVIEKVTYIGVEVKTAAVFRRYLIP